MCREIIEMTIRNGGFTDTVEKTGFSVAVNGNEKVVELSEFNEKIVHGYKRNMKKGMVLGTWVNDNKVYLDTVKVFKDKDEALKLAKLQNELAIYDLENELELFVK